MATLSPPELVDWLSQNQFLTSVQTDALRPLLRSLPDSLALAKELLGRDWLTAYQANQIMQGNHEQLVLGCYRLRERIGEGAMGQIFKAWSLRLGRFVAVKTLSKELINSEKAMERFRKEVATAAQLDHPNIALVRDADDDGGRPYLVMDFIDGVNLSQVVKQQGPVPIHQAVEYARQSALGLQHAFERGIVHRDIKPSNLMVTAIRNNGDALPMVKILDFGLARFQSEEDDSTRLTQMGRMLGTIDYIAPEQAQDARSADIRADIYGLGCTLYYLLTGKPPFAGKDIVEKLGPRMTGEPPWVRAVRADVSPQLEEVLRKMMARLPEDRYQTPIEVAQALAPHAVPIALATPVSRPVPEGVALALPVTASAGNVPLAAAITPEPPPANEPDAFLGMTATGRDLSTRNSAAAPPNLKARPFPTKLVVLLGGSVVLFSLISCACVFSFFFFGRQPERKVGVIRINKKTDWSMPDKRATEGRFHFVNVHIDRIDCKGKIKVLLKDLPPGVTFDEVTLAPNATAGYVKFTVSWGTPPLEKEIKVYAECEADGAKAEYPMTLVIKEDPLKK
jgi:serine/threonine protein kinase